MDEVALLESDRLKISVYYDQGGPLDFFAELPDSQELKRRNVPEDIVRRTEALEEHEIFVGEFLKEGKNHSYYQGRPDLAVIKYSKDENSVNEHLESVRLGEVKHTESNSTFSTGLQQLLEYIYLARVNDELLFGRKLSEDSVVGSIFTDGVETERDEVGYIEHFTTEDLIEQFE
jgi:hypothetical protein